MNKPILAWPDVVLDLQDALSELPEPIYIVGGAVRDALLRRPIKDVDMAVPTGGIALARRIANAFHGDVFPLDHERDVGRALIDTPDGRLVIDVARFRGDDLEADLRDRDFTMNALAVDLRGDLNAVIDPTGGLPDLLKKLLRRCHPDAISRDPIRALRAVRQSVQFGCRIEAETISDVRANAPRLSEISVERVRDELFKLLALGRAAAALRVADRLGLLTVIFPELIALHDLKQHRHHAHDAWNHTLAVIDALSDILMTISPQRTDATAAQFNLGMIVMSMDRYRARLQTHFGQVWPDDRSHRALLLLAALLHDIGKGMMPPHVDDQGEPRFPGHELAGADAALERVTALRLSSAESDLVVKLVRYHMGSALWRDELRPVDIYRYWKAMGEAGIDLIMLTLADYLGALGAGYDQQVWLRLIERAQALLHAYYEESEQLVNPPVLVNGGDLIKAFKLRPGPVIGDLLEVIREAQVSGEVHTTEEALRLARQHLDSRPQFLK